MTTNYGVGNSAAATNQYAPATAQDTRAIEMCLTDFVASWNRHDPAQMASAWAEDGDLITPWGRVCKGRSQVQQNFREEQEGPMKRSNHQMKIGSIRFAANDVAIVDADCAISGASGPDGKAMPTINPHVTMMLSKAEGDWKIVAARPVMYVPAPGAAS